MPLDHYVTLGRSGLRVSPFALGAMTFGEDPAAAGASVEESEQILAAYLDRGGNFIDTANFYTNGHSEKILGDFFAAQPGRRERVVLASKFFGNLYPGDPNGGGAGRGAIIAQLDETAAPAAHRLPRPVLAAQLGPQHPDRGDDARARRPGPRGQDPLHRVLQHARLGDRPGADASALLRGWTPLIALQVEYSLLARTVEGELAPFALDQGMALVPWSPLKNGFLSGKYRRGAEVGRLRPRRLCRRPERRRVSTSSTPSPRSPRDSEPVPAAVALAWLRARPGHRRADHRRPAAGPPRGNLAGARRHARPRPATALDEVSAPTLNYPAG